jgi:hypothetical protein
MEITRPTRRQRRTAWLLIGAVAGVGLGLTLGRMLTSKPVTEASVKQADCRDVRAAIAAYDRTHDWPQLDVSLAVVKVHTEEQLAPHGSAAWPDLNQLSVDLGASQPGQRTGFEHDNLLGDCPA